MEENTVPRRPKRAKTKLAMAKFSGGNFDTN
jgi:hypothetical protein